MVISAVFIIPSANANELEYSNESLIIAEEKEDGNRALEGKAYFVLGEAYCDLNEPSRAMECHKNHLSIAREVGDRKGKVSAYLNIGDVPRAMEYYKQSLSNAEEIGDRDGQGRAYCRLGMCYRNLHDLKEAIECYKQHLRIAEEIGDRMAEACAHVDLGQSFLES